MKKIYYFNFLATLCILFASCTKELTYESEQMSIAENGVLADHEYVQIDGIKWATKNIGATTIAGSYESCIGDYFSWGEISPRYNSKERGTGLYHYNLSINWKPQYTTGYAANNYNKFETSPLDGIHDAASSIWGNQWRMPTIADFKVLAAACGVDLEDGKLVTPTDKITEGGVYELTEDQTFEPEYSGVAGVLFVSKVDISKRVFFPASGHIYNLSAYSSIGTEGDYWSAEQYIGGNSVKTLHFYVSSLSTIRNGVSMPSYGLTIRPVAK